VLVFEGFPLDIGWEFTLKCNLRCNHCASAAGLPRNNELTTKEALRICDQFPDLLVQHVCFTGGEPLLRSDWEEIVLYLKDLGITSDILTNGLLLDEETVCKIRNAGIFAVGISLDGLEKTHDYIRGFKGSFEHVTKGITMLQKKGVRLNVITTVNALNIGELPSILQLLESLGVNYWRLQPIMPSGRANNFKGLKIDDDQIILSLGSFIKDWTPKAEKNKLKIICADGMEYIDGALDLGRPWRGCPAGRVCCDITSDGKVKGCLSLPDDIVEGDLRKNDLWDIWFNPNSFAYTRKFSSDQLGVNCKSCDKANECLGGCSANSYTVTSKFHNDPYCYYKINKDKAEQMLRAQV
jgi:radical SAM protein with 4Fe4S-binding SPASM domain